MAEQKRYYWLKLDKDFFRSKRIKKLRRLAGGDTFTIIYLKMQLLSLATAGCLEYTGLESSFEEELSLDIDEDIENVKITVAYLLKCGLLIENDTCEYAMPFVQDSIGSETSVAERVRKYRANQKTLQCNASETQVKQIGNVEIDIDIDKEKEKEKNTLVDSSESSSELLGEKNAKAEELEREKHNFEEIYKRYPKKKGKAKAFDYYRQYLKGRKMSTGTVKLTNEQMWAAVKKYKEEKESKDTELEFYQDFSTFMNKTILDYLEE